MKKNLKVLLSILLIIGIIGGSPIVLERVRVERANNTYQLAIDGRTIENISKESKKEELFEKLKQIDVSTVVFRNMSITELSLYRDIRYMTVNDYLEDKDNFGYKVDGFIPKYAAKDDIVIMISKNDFDENEINIIKAFLEDFDMYEDKDDVYLYINEPLEVVYRENKVKNYLVTSRFFIDEKGIEEIRKAGLSPILSVFNPTDEKMQDIIFNQIIELHNKYGVDKVQMPSKDVIGYPNNTTKYLDEFKKMGISIVTTEFETTTGLNAYAEKGQENLIRGHEINVNLLKLSSDDFVARISRAVKERNMRVIVISEYIDYTNINTVSKSIDSLVSNLNSAQQQLSRGYKNGIATNFEIMGRDTNSEMFVGLASASLVALVILSIFDRSKKASMLSVLGFIAVFAGTIIISKTQINIAIKLYALSMAILGACAAIIIPYKMKVNSAIVKYILGSLLATLSGLLVASIMYGTDYILKLKAFSGVKVLYILPLVLIAIWVIIDSSILRNINLRKYNIKNIRFDKGTCINNIKRIKWYHIVLVLAIVVLGFVYITRSGNGGNATALELEFRRWLEEVLYVRPRTKEFMLGYPALLVAFYMCNKKIKYGEYVFILAAIGTMSTANTFTHLHTPIVYSLLRTAYGVVLGFIIGIIYIAIFNQIIKYIKKEK